MREHTVVPVITKHARKRFIERVGYLEDHEMLWFATIPNKKFRFIWKWDRKIIRRNKHKIVVVERRLITVIERKRVKTVEG